MLNASRYKYRIAVLTCWSGPYPWYLPYFIHSCSFNPTLDFFIITDNLELNVNKPANVKVIFKAVKDIEKIAAKKFGFPVNISMAYKLNDYKPAYGFLFPDIIKDYDFWAHSDLDVVYGDIRSFLHDEMLSVYEFVSVRHDYTAGCFCLYKNCKKINTLFMQSRDYKRVMSDPKHYCFDECNFAWNQLKEGVPILQANTEVESFTHIVKTAEQKGEIKAYFDFILMEGKTGKIIFDRGKIIYKNQFEAILYHLCSLRLAYFPQKAVKEVPDKYYFSPTRIYHSRKTISRT